MPLNKILYSLYTTHGGFENATKIVEEIYPEIGCGNNSTAFRFVGGQVLKLHKLSDLPYHNFLLFCLKTHRERQELIDGNHFPNIASYFEIDDFLCILMEQLIPWNEEIAERASIDVVGHCGLNHLDICEVIKNRFMYKHICKKFGESHAYAWGKAKVTDHLENSLQLLFDEVFDGNCAIDLNPNNVMYRVIDSKVSAVIIDPFTLM